MVLLGRGGRRRGRDQRYLGPGSVDRISAKVDLKSVLGSFHPESFGRFHIAVAELQRFENFCTLVAGRGEAPPGRQGADPELMFKVTQLQNRSIKNLQNQAGSSSKYP